MMTSRYRIKQSSQKWADMQQGAAFCRPVDLSAAGAPIKFLFGGVALSRLSFNLYFRSQAVESTSNEEQ